MDKVSYKLKLHATARVHYFVQMFQFLKTFRGTVWGSSCTNIERGKGVGGAFALLLKLHDLLLHSILIQIFLTIQCYETYSSFLVKLHHLDS